MALPLVHVLVVNWNGREHLEACFDTLLAGSYGNARFVLIDNGSEDDSVAFVRERYGADARVEVVVCPKNLGWSGGNNVGIERALAAGADYVLLLNNDTAVAADVIEKLVDAAEHDPAVGALAPKMVLFDDPAILNSVGLACSVIGASWDIGIGRLDGVRWNDPQPVIGVCGGACLLRTAVLRKTGLLPSDFGIYLDDLDLCLRIWNAGYEVRSCPQAVVRHKFGATMDQGKRARKKYYLNTRNRMYVVLRNFPASKSLEVAAAFGVGECRAIGRALLDGAGWRARAHVRAWLAAAAYVPRAVAARRRHRRDGLVGGRFWRLVRRDRLFFQGAEFPADGWYAARDVAGTRVRPMSARAHVQVEAGELRVTTVNCYPRLGAVAVDVSQDGRPIARLETQDRAEQVLTVSAGLLQFAAARIFDADDTGERMDIGGWIGIERV